MTQNHAISDEKLNALLDNELDAEERADLLRMLQQDTEIAARYRELRQVKEAISVAYANPPLPLVKERLNKIGNISRGHMIAASFVMLLTGSLLGWMGGIQGARQGPDMLNLDQLHVTPVTNDRIVIHINSMNAKRVDSVLMTAEQLLQTYRNQNKRLQLEVIANEEGLGLLREGSPYTGEIQALSDKYTNISFKACGIAKKVAEMKEQQEITLLPQAQQVPAALDQILKRIKEQWTYVKG